MLRLGSIVQGKLIEAIDSKHWIVSFNGRLIQVVNQTPMDFKKNKMISLRVKNDRPLELQVETGAPKQRSLNLKI